MLKDQGDTPPTGGLIPKDEPAKDNRDASKIPKGVLDFSSGSEEDEDEQRFRRKASNASAVDGNQTGTAAGPVRMSLLQHGFSRLLERVKGRPELEEGDSSPVVEESLSDTDAEDREKLTKNECASSDVYTSSSTGNRSVCPLKLATEPLNISSDSDREDTTNGAWGRRERVENTSPDRKPQNLKNRVSTVPCFESCSDESEDFDLEARIQPKERTLNSRKGQDRRRGALVCNKRKTASARNQVRSKYTEAIETYTSSEDEHTPVKKGRSTGSKASKGGMAEDGHGAATAERTNRQVPKGVSFTNMKSQTSPGSKGKDGAIDGVLGQFSAYSNMIITFHN